ncbi:MAG: sulfatase-like hydrolase/transferase, partial [Candidatus Nealsonbacteria bacterium]|nr:sulfatase-like hydrolase/transferase [Candidatus Nealsonbacteria bacterium]
MWRSLSRALVLGVGVTCTSVTSLAKDERPNVLFVVVDDLRPELGCYGNRHIRSPHIDRLAREGLLFERAYCQEAVCMSSRNSMLSGYRPDSKEIWT